MDLSDIIFIGIEIDNIYRGLIFLIVMTKCQFFLAVSCQLSAISYQPNTVDGRWSTDHRQLTTDNGQWSQTIDYRPQTMDNGLQTTDN